jgi:LmbE family N-acetylglucosaminyl deacetylase
MKRVVLALVATTLFAAPLSLHAQGGGAASAVPNDAADTRRVLVIGAHPDDEDTQLIAWLQRGGRAETAYLSLTRGDGGQNLIGNELGEPLGVIRTQELLAARRIDGAHQYFTRAYDFGFSKTAAETFAHWPKDSLLNDVVSVVRAFRPQVIVAIFSGTPADGHGQHQVSAILAKEVYETAAMDTMRFPVSRFGPAWTPLKLYRAAYFAPQGATVRFNVGEYNPAIGKSYAEIAGESRSQHKSQGFGSLQRKGVVWDQLAWEASRVNDAASARRETSLFDGISAKPLPVQSAVQQRIERDVAVEAIADRQNVALGDSARVTVTVYNRSAETIYTKEGTAVLPDSSFRWTTFYRGAEITQPWWLATPRNGDLFSPQLPRVTGNGKSWANTTEEARDRGAAVDVPISVSSSGDPVVTKVAPIVYRYVDLIRGDIQRPLIVTPAVSISLERPTELARANTPLERFFTVTLRSAMMKAAPVQVSLRLPAGLAADSTSRTITLDSAATRSITFHVRGRLAPGVHQLSATATANGATYQTGYIPIEYEHINPQRIYRPAQVAINAVDINVPSRLNVAYVKGVGDNVEPALEELGIPVTIVEPRALPTVDLSKFSTVVVGPRAYQASRELIDNNAYLLNYAKSGGTLVVQYGQYEMTAPGMMPYAISIARPHDRVTEETAPITILDAASPALRRPNAISASDFNGWVQERSLYMPRTFDANYHAVVSLHDPGEPSNNGGILVAPYGKGLYVYTTLAFFRQLPAGVPGATKLFVNLLSMTGSDVTSRSSVSAGK